MGVVSDRDLLAATVIGSGNNIAELLMLEVFGGLDAYTAAASSWLDSVGLADTAVVGIPNEQWGETVLAFVALKPGQTLELETLQAFCRERLAGYKIPSKLEIIDAIPRNASGKSLKTILRQPYWEGKQRQVS